MGIQYLSLRTVRVKRWFISVFVYVPGRQQKAFLQEKLKSRESRGQNHEGATLQSLPLSSWQQDEAEGAWAQAVVELSYLPAPAPGCYLWVVHLHHLESKPGVDTVRVPTADLWRDCNIPPQAPRKGSVQILSLKPESILQGSLSAPASPDLQVSLESWVRETKSLRRALVWPLTLSISVTWAKSLTSSGVYFSSAKCGTLDYGRASQT